MKIIAIKHCSAGNESIGNMWKETKIFEEHNTLKDVLDWGMDSHEKRKGYLVTTLELSVAHEEARE